MAITNLRMFATMLAIYIKKNMGSVHRGAMLIRCINDGNLVAAVYGNDNFVADAKTRREVELVRHQLAQASLEELGFGLTPDGETWTLLVRAKVDRFQTVAGKAFHMEMVRIFLEDAVEGAWSGVCGGRAGGARFSIPQGQATG